MTDPFVFLVSFVASSAAAIFLWVFIIRLLMDRVKYPVSYGAVALLGMVIGVSASFLLEAASGESLSVSLHIGIVIAVLFVLFFQFFLLDLLTALISRLRRSSKTMRDPA
ncbi:MAG: hypothetical protein AAGA39_10325 [Pseudomonadota bacterium]